MEDLRALLDLLDRLKAQHRAGITPPFGQLEELFDSAARVREELAAIENGMSPPSGGVQPVTSALSESGPAAPLARIEAKEALTRVVVTLTPGARAVVESAAA